MFFALQIFLRSVIMRKNIMVVMIYVYKRDHGDIYGAGSFYL